MSLLSCSNQAGPFGIPAWPPPAPHSAPRPLFPCLAPSCCPGRGPCPGAGSLLLARGSLMARLWLAVPGCWLSTCGHCRGDSSTRIQGVSWARRWSSLQPHFWVGSQTLLHSASFWVPQPDSLPQSSMGYPDPSRGARPSMVVGIWVATCCLQGTPRRGHEHPATAKLETPVTSWPLPASFPGKTLLLAHEQPQICPIPRSPEQPGTPVVPSCQP